MEPTSGPLSFKGTIFHVWKGNQPCRIYVTDRQVYFIRRVVSVGINPGAAAAIGGQFGLLGGLAVGLAGAAKAKNSADLVTDDDPTPPDQLLSRHADNHAIAISDISDARIEPKGKYVSYGPNAGRWHFTHRGDAKETVVLLESPADVSQAVSMLGSVLGASESGFTDDGDRADLVTDFPLPSEHAEVVTAIQSLTELLGERAPASCRTVRFEVRVASPGHSRPLEILVGDGDRPDELRPEIDPAIDQATMRVARKLSPSVRTFPGLVIEMTRLDQGRWRNHARLMNKR